MNAPTTRTSPSPLPLSPEVAVNTVTEDSPVCHELRTLVVYTIAAVEAGTKHLARLEVERRARFNAD